MVNPNRFYTYAYLREDRTPYYIGKGAGNRAYCKRSGEVKPPKDKLRIILLKQNLLEEDAFKHEIYMISVFGRKDLGTGILHNRTDGGEGFSGIIRSEEYKRKLSEMRKGKYIGEKNPRYGKRHTEETKKKIGESKKGKKFSESHKRKMSESHKGQVVSKETRQKISESKRGEKHYLYRKSIPIETKRKMSEANKNKKWWNDGCGNTRFAEKCPGEGWVLGRGRIKKNKYHKDN